MLLRNRRGFTLTEVLIVLVILTIFFAILVTMVHGVVTAYRFSKTTLQALYAESYIRFFFDMLENELRWAGSGTHLMREGFSSSPPPTGDPDLHNQVRFGKMSGITRVRFSEVLDYLWIRTWGIDVRVEGQEIAFYLTYLKTYPVLFKRVPNITNRYVALNTGFVGKSNWVISASRLSTGANEYFSTLVNVSVTMPNGTPFTGGEIRKNDELNIVCPGNVKWHEYIYFVVESVGRGLFGIDFGEGFRRIRVAFNPSTRTIYVTKYSPVSGASITQRILENVKNFEIYLARQGGAGLDFERVDPATWNTRKPTVAVSQLVGFKFLIEWESPWLVGARPILIRKERVILLPEVLDSSM
ncbi:type II secretion system protein [Fervidobacterium thailandense]|uniref:Prepilin-type N-terminal cleavage/methylation domain-containing protein n=1 Tax=Fervidobacterium thailandense TaxID=1008305 RepID=A0A1E3G2T8_9BACT|nr:prepilin-type N-terminal cleavage/methylation domain-containing protein [Fervidobacterium thailandense]ODN30482.1 hypothetical protein A4H02_05495 [Fervidobacterium thailandense]